VADIRPQAGPQEAFLSSSADIAIYGGAAFGGKTFGLLMEPLRHVDNPQFGAVYFRRTMPMITAEGAGWDTASDLYTQLAARMLQSPEHAGVFPSGAKVGFHQLQYEETVHDWQSSQIPLLLFDELTQFTRRQFFYMLSRNRSTCGVRSYVRAACNPDPDSWVREFISWWIDPESGLPILERSGVLRYFVRINDVIEWADSAAELIERFGKAAGFEEDPEPLSVTFIPALASDNKIGLAKDPGYLAKLKALPRWEREQLLGGNWNARASAGMIFARSDFEIVDACPNDITGSIRYWDRAATEQSEGSPDPDWTAGVKLTKAFNGLFYIEDVERFRARPLGVKTTIGNIASQDGRGCAIGIEQDPGQAGISEAEDLVRSLAGYNVAAYPARQDKVTRWKPLSAQVQAGNVKLVRGAWNEAFITELCALTDNPKEYGHDDQGDAAAGAFNALTSSPPADARAGAALASRRSRG
jgi:predicted phage terminase large subunit-like protein